MNKKIIRLIRRFFVCTDKYKARFDNYRTFKNNHKAAISLCKCKNYPQLSQIEKTEIILYWKKFGISFPDFTWFEMYYSETGIHDPKFIPNTIACILFPQLNCRDVEM